MDDSICHNPGCGTSRNTSAMIRNSGTETDIIEYVKNPPSRDWRVQLTADAGLTVRQALREKGTPYANISSTRIARCR